MIGCSCQCPPMTTTGRGRTCRFPKAGWRPSAADLQFLHHLPRVPLRNCKSKSGTRIINLLVPSWFSKFVSERAALYHELRKPGTSAADLQFLHHLPRVVAANF